MDKELGDNSPVHVFGAVVGGLVNTYQQYNRNGGSFDNFSYTELGVNVTTGAWSAGASTIGGAIIRGGMASGGNESYNQVVNVESNNLREKVWEVGKATVSGFATSASTAVIGKVGNQIVIPKNIINKPLDLGSRTLKKPLEVITGISAVVITNKETNNE